MTTPDVITVDRGADCVARQAVVDARPDEIFALLSNPHRHHEFDGSGTVRAEAIGPRVLEQGDRFRVSMKMAGVPYGITSTVTRLEKDALIEWRHPGGHRWRWELEPVDERRTRVTEIFDRSGALVPALLKVIRADDRNAEGIEQSLARLQRRFARP